MKITTLSFIFLLFCGNFQTINKLANTQWLFVKLVNGEKTQIADMSCGTTLNFDDKGQFNGFSGWNHFNGNYSATSKGKLSMDNPLRTKKAGLIKCKMGELLFDVFPNVEKYSIDSDTLYLCTADCTQMIYVKIK